ncbi:MAG: hypothetical protein KAH24_07610 [Holophagae bacterium]|nr:hypothetical protein [Holophagae bacterium]
MKRPIRQIIPLTDICISVKFSVCPTSVKAVVSGEEIEFEYTDGHVDFCVNISGAYELIVIE